MTSHTDQFRLLHTMLRVKDLDAALDFYTNKLGMRLLRKTDFPSGEFTLAFVGYGDEESEIFVSFNNNNRDYPVRNALAMKRLLGQAAADEPPAGTGDLFT